MAFPVWQTSLDSLDFCWRERRALARFGAIPLIASIALSFVGAAFGLSQTEVTPGLIVLGISQTLFFLPLTITCYRMVVLGPSEARKRPVFALGRLEWRLLWWQVQILIAIGAIGLACYEMTLLIRELGGQLGYPDLFMAVNVVWTVSWLVGLILLMARLAMVLVLVALDRPVSFKASWQMTRGLAWRLLGGTMLIGVAGLLVGGIFSGVVKLIVLGLTSMGASLSFEPYMPLPGENFGRLVTMVAVAALFGFVYRKLTAEASSAVAEAEPAPPSKSVANLKLFNAVVWLYLWLSQALSPTFVPPGGDYWTEKAIQVFSFGPFDDIPRLLGRGVWVFVLWLTIHLFLGRQKKSKSLAPTANSDSMPDSAP